MCSGILNLICNRINSAKSNVHSIPGIGIFPATRAPTSDLNVTLGLALSSPNVRYGDLDGHFDLTNDPTQPGFLFEDGWLVARDVPGLGCTVEL